MNVAWPALGHEDDDNIVTVDQSRSEKPRKRRSRRNVTPVVIHDERRHRGRRQVSSHIDIGLSGSSSLMRRIGHGDPDGEWNQRRGLRRRRRSSHDLGTDILGRFKDNARTSRYRVDGSPPSRHRSAFPTNPESSGFSSLLAQMSLTKGGAKRTDDHRLWNGPPRSEYSSSSSYRSSSSRSASLSDESRTKSSLPSRNSPYRPLPEGLCWIRLLRLLRGSSESPLQCDLVHINSRKPLYETVSYCWGDSRGRDCIEIDGCVVDIPCNAAHALRRLRLADRDRMLWIDSICINQSDLEERNHQVAQMHEIYSRGSRNLIWLGHDDGTVGDALDTIHRVVEEIKLETNNLANYQAVLRNNRGQIRLSAKKFTFDFDIEPLLRFFARPWFSRMWIIQEASLARSNRCFCGPHEFDLADVLRTAQWLYHKQMQLPTYKVALEQLNDHIVDAAILANFCDPDFGWFKTVTTSTRPEGLLFTLLDNLARFETTNAKDRVFGLLGLHKRLAGSSSHDWLLRCDYTRSLADVFRDATLRSIREWNRLDSLSWVQHRIEDVNPDRLPSWVPSWHRKWDMSLDARLLATFFDADGGLQADSSRTDELVDDFSSLALVGCFVDEGSGGSVEALTEVCLDIGTLPAFLDSALRLHQQHCTSIEGDGLEAFASALLAGRNSDNEPATKEDLQGYEKLQEHRKAHNQLPPATRYVSSLKSNSNSEIRPVGDPAASRFREACWNSCHRRRFFVTQSGRIGLGPQSMQAGDVVAILYGGKWPFVLRPVARDGKLCYRLVGQCYLHGTMFGEAVQAHHDRGNHDMLFEIF